jgi:hypothetical protein
MDEAARGVLAAADTWMTAMLAMTDADEEQRGADTDEAAFEQAEVELAAAVLAWRDSIKS